MSSLPLVSIVCLCYNHKEFVRESVLSVINQSYENIEIILVDDASTDGSKEVISDIVTDYPGIQWINIEQNIGNCKAFNMALPLCKGEFIIDLAADDLLTVDRVKLGVETLRSKSDDYGVHYGDVLFVDNEGNSLGANSERLKKRGLSERGPEGDLYAKLLSTFFLSSPSMMSKREVFDRLGGYDESLAYEDLDFWIRSSRTFKYCYSHEILVKKRVLSTSHSAQQYKLNSPQMLSTFIVCQKAFSLNQTKEEDKALLDRMKYEIKRSLMSGNFSLVYKYVQLSKKVKKRKTFLN